MRLGTLYGPVRFPVATEQAKLLSKAISLGSMRYDKFMSERFESSWLALNNSLCRQAIIPQVVVMARLRRQSASSCQKCLEW